MAEPGEQLVDRIVQRLSGRDEQLLGTQERNERPSHPRWHAGDLGASPSLCEELAHPSRREVVALEPASRKPPTEAGKEPKLHRCPLRSIAGGAEL